MFSRYEVSQAKSCHEQSVRNGAAGAKHAGSHERPDRASWKELTLGRHLTRIRIL